MLTESVLSFMTDIWELSAFAKASKQSVPSKVCSTCTVLGLLIVFIGGLSFLCCTN